MDSSEFLEVVKYLQNNSENEIAIKEFCEDHNIDIDSCGVLKQLAISGKKHIDSVSKAILEEGNVEIEKIVEYSKFVQEFLKVHAFVSPLFIRSYPRDKIADFDNKKWASIMKNEKVRNLDNSYKEILLKMAFNFGVFENDNSDSKDVDEAQKRTNNLINILNSELTQDNGLDKFADFKYLDYEYNFEKYNFLRNNYSCINEINLQEFQENWDLIDRYVDKKDFENIKKFIDISNRNGNDTFNAYMEMHASKTSKSYMKKYKELMGYMESRTKTSIPEIKGKAKNGYTYEVLPFTDIRALRFGDAENVKSCEHLAGNAETSLFYMLMEGKARGILIKDEKGEAIANSTITHQIDKTGKSYVCFDSIEVNSSKLDIGIKKFQKLKLTIRDLYKQGKIEGLELESIKRYFEETNDKKRINRKEINTLEVSDKIRACIESMISELIQEDEVIRKEQLKKGDITQEEFDMMLLKNGVFTVGNRGFGKMYLDDLASIKKSEKELLPVPSKGREIYKRMHVKNLENLLDKIATRSLDVLTVVGATAATATFLTGAAPALPFVALGGVAFGTKSVYKNIYKNKQHGIYTDAKKDQKILYDGRKDQDRSKISKERVKELNEKLVYTQEKMFMPTQVSKLDEETKKNIFRVQEVMGKDAFGEEDKEKFVMGSKNWYVLFSNEDKKIVINDVVMQGNSCMKKGKWKDSQNDLLDSLKQMIVSADKKDMTVEFEIADNNANKFCKKYFKEVFDEVRKTENQPSRNTQYVKENRRMTGELTFEM